MRIPVSSILTMIRDYLGEDALVAWDRDIGAWEYTRESHVEMLFVHSDFLPPVIHNRNRHVLIDRVLPAYAGIFGDTTIYHDMPQYHDNTIWLYAPRILCVVDASNALGMYWVDATKLHGPKRENNVW